MKDPLNQDESQKNCKEDPDINDKLERGSDQGK